MPPAPCTARARLRAPSPKAARRARVGGPTGREGMQLAAREAKLNSQFGQVRGMRDSMSAVVDGNGSSGKQRQVPERPGIAQAVSQGET